MSSDRSKDARRLLATEVPPFTAEARVKQYAGLTREQGDAILSQCAALYGRGERKICSAHRSGKLTNSFKSDFLRRHRIPGRWFNSMRVSALGKYASVKELQPLELDDLQRRIAAAEKKIALLQDELDNLGADGDNPSKKRNGRRRRKQGKPRTQRQEIRAQIHYKKRRLFSLRADRDSLAAAIAAGHVSVCFGSKRLWHKKYNLAANGYETHEEWLADWQAARRDEIFLMGSRDENAGCQLCVATLNADGTFDLRMRIPDALIPKGGSKYLVMPNVRIAYGREHILAALDCNARFAAYRREHGEREARATDLGQAISYRFLLDQKGWRVFATTEMEHIPSVTDLSRGAVGVDINEDHLAVCEINESGNKLHAFSVPLMVKGKSAHQARALIGDAVAAVVKYAREAGKPIVTEDLDFRRKKAQLELQPRGYRRMLSAFAYGKIRDGLVSRGYRHGVQVFRVNAAYSSIIGRGKFQRKYGLSAHQAAAMVIARRMMNCSERVPRRGVELPLGKGLHGTFPATVAGAGNGSGVRRKWKHVWSDWGVLNGQWRAECRRVRAHPAGAEARGSPCHDVPVVISA